MIETGYLPARRAPGRHARRLLARAAGAWPGLASLLLLLGACTLQRQALVQASTTDLRGLSENDLRLCAGIPERTAKGTHGAEFWSYERSVSPGGSISSPYGGVSLSGREECRATFEMVGGRVSRLAFSRVSGSETAPLASCAPLVQACEAMAVAGEAPPVSPQAASPAEDGR